MPKAISARSRSSSTISRKLRRPRAAYWAFRAIAQRRAIELRYHSRSDRRDGVLPRRRFARWLSARRSPATPPRCCRPYSERVTLPALSRNRVTSPTMPPLCAHSRSQVTGCTRCLELCPTSAITPEGDHVIIDPNVCAGCGQCAAACPTGAASYALPTEDALMRRLRAMLIAYREAGGEQAVVLVHDDPHGAPVD